MSNYLFFDQITQLRALGLTGKGIGIGHLDTGIQPGDYLDVSTIAAFCTFDESGNLLTDQAPSDHQSHGTHTGGIIVGRYSSDRGMGIAPGAQLHSAAVLGAGDTIVRILKGMAWMCSQPVRVVCLPLGVPGFNPIFYPMINALLQRDILCIAAIGNNNPGRSGSPGNYDNVLTVGSVGKKDRPSPFSGTESDSGGKCIKPEVMAPGKSIIGPVGQHKLKKESGTSQATACVAGLSALLLERSKHLTAAQLAYCIELAGQHSERADETYSVHGTVSPIIALRQAEEPFVPRAPHIRTASLSGKFMDKLLKQEIQQEGDEPIRMIFVAKEAPEIVQRLETLFHEQAQQTEYISEGQLGIVTVSKRFAAELTRQDEVVVASSTRISIQPEPSDLPSEEPDQLNLFNTDLFD